MKILTTLYLFLTLSLISCESGNIQSSANSNPAYSDSIETKIDRVINNLQQTTTVDGQFKSSGLYERMKLSNTPGVSVAVINNGKLEWARGFGMRDISKQLKVTTETIFQVGSVSKPIFALSAMLLKQSGTIDLDADVNNYLSSWKVPKVGEWQPKITLRQLLSHTAGTTVHGFLGYATDEPIPSVPQLLDGLPPANSSPVRVNTLPGLSFRYSGGGTTIAQLAVEEALNQPFHEIIQEKTFNPLGLDYSTYNQYLTPELEQIASTGYTYKNYPLKTNHHIYPEMAAAGLWSNPSEMALILIEIQKALRGESELINEEIVQEMLTPQKVANHIGIGFFLEGNSDSQRFGHRGWDEGFVTRVVAYKNTGQGAVVMVNSNEGSSLLDEILRSIAIEYDWENFMPGQVEYSTLEHAQLNKLKGQYSSNEGVTVTISNEGNNLRLTYLNQDPISLSYFGEDMKFGNPNLNINVSFKDGNLTLNQSNNSIRFEKVPD